jgi:TatD DNase family protein
MAWQRERFRTHIRAARQAQLPMVIHTRQASDDTIAILQEEGECGDAHSAGGVFHCFTESMQVARAALDMGFYISLSGILTFKSAADLREVAKFVPDDRLLIETDSPYLAPVPHRGKLNNPSYVPLVAQLLGELRGCTSQAIGELTTSNFLRLFHKTQE